MPDDRYNDGSRFGAVPAVARSGVEEYVDDDGAPLALRQARKPAVQRRSSMFMTACLVVTVLMAIGALIVSIIAFTKAPHSSSSSSSSSHRAGKLHVDNDDSYSSTVSSGPGEGEFSTESFSVSLDTASASTVSSEEDSVSSVTDSSIDSASSVSSSALPPPPQPPPSTVASTTTVQTSRFTRVNVPLRAFFSPAATIAPPPPPPRVAVHDGGRRHSVDLLFLCTIRPAGSGSCLSLFTYENADAAQVIVPAGTAGNSVSTVDGGDAGQLETFLPGLHFGAASFMWNCRDYDEATWTLQGASATALPDDAPCPSIAELL